ncbi:Transmembrane protein 53-like protein [Dinothrombium tinctorium]|uniref:Transmembrane protein 53-like protein n=1 Tax=Dinothrombium tinctorium TaxID=1965070 RepID=A0A3S3NQ11_9ACAR|nr:Transmembrane protein 53-like protein [Dinothrombium tinctorium]RWS03855.1 Transmembrane protein 53-like protein [Dinothrombium tinctorium]
MSLKHCGPVVPLIRSHGTQGLAEHESSSSNYVCEGQRPLTVILAWLAAKEKHLEKYRSIWLQRGFDVLTVKMSPYQFLVPSIGAKNLITDLLKFLYTSRKHYKDIILHCFSVGGYEYGEMLTQLQDKNYLKQISMNSSESENQVKSQIDKLIKGIIMDSPVNIHGAPNGIARAITDNSFLVKFVENAINYHLKVAYPIATKHYMEASDNAHSNYIKAPSLFFASEADPIGMPWMSLKLKECWEKLGIPVDFKCFKNSGHVQHFPMYPEEYTKNIDNFLSKVNFET